MIVDQAVFNSALIKIGNPPFEQTQGWIDFKSDKNTKYLYFVDDNGNPSLACSGRVMKKRLVGNILDITGEVIGRNVSQKQITSFFSSIISEANCNMIIYNSVSVHDCEFEIAVRRAGFTRPFGFRTCPLTIFVDIQEERKPDRMWKRNLKKAQENDLRFELVEHPTLNDATVFVRLFDELKEMKSLGYSLSPDKVFDLVKYEGYKLFFVSKDSERLCGRIIYFDEASHISYDVFAANSFKSRKYSATHFIMEQIFAYLRGKECELFDFSRIPPSNNETDSVYLFKKSAGGYPIQYNGEWIWGKNKYLPLFLCIYNFFIRKAHNY